MPASKPAPSDVNLVRLVASKVASREKTPLSPKKLLLSKWTAVTPLLKEKHFVVVRVIDAEPPSPLTREVVLEAVHSKRSMRLHWRELTLADTWRRGWV